MTNANITYVVLGHLEDPIDQINGILQVYPRSKPTITNLYNDLLSAVMDVTTPYFCILDGGEDRLLPGFVDSIEYRITQMETQKVPLGYADEYVGDQIVPSGVFSLNAFKTRPTMLHHGIVCCTKSAQSMSWPVSSPSAGHILGVILYGTLAQRGFVYHKVPVYQWNPSINGARCWLGTNHAITNGINWITNLPHNN